MRFCCQKARRILNVTAPSQQVVAMYFSTGPVRPAMGAVRVIPPDSATSVSPQRTSPVIVCSSIVCALVDPLGIFWPLLIQSRQISSKGFSCGQVYCRLFCTSCSPSVFLAHVRCSHCEPESQRNEPWPVCDSHCCKSCRSLAVRSACLQCALHVRRRASRARLQGQSESVHAPARWACSRNEHYRSANCWIIPRICRMLGNADPPP